MKLFIVGFPGDLEEVELLEIFSVYGAVSAVKIITDRNTGKSKCYGFVTMDDRPGADRAIAALDGASLDERVISVRIANLKANDLSATVPAKKIKTANKKRPRRDI